MENSKKQKRRTALYFYVLLAILPLLVAATYTWFSISQVPRVSDMELYVNANKGLELAMNYDAVEEEWGQRLDFLDIVTEEVPLKPASWSQERQSFVTIRYGADGRMTDEWVNLNDEENANRNDGNGYYAVGTFFARSSKGHPPKPSGKKGKGAAEKAEELIDEDALRLQVMQELLEEVQQQKKEKE